MSIAQQKEIAEALRRFDQRLSPDEQKSIRDLDGKIQSLGDEDRSRYLAVLRRYHNWLESLPGSVRDRILATPPSERMTMVQGLLARYPIARDQTPYWLQFVEIGDGSPFELAAVFKIWQRLTPPQRREVEGLPTLQKKREELFKKGRELGIRRDITAPDFRIEEWIPKVEAKIEELRLADPDLKFALARVEARADAAKLKADSSAKLKAEANPRAGLLMLRRLAINLYFLSQDPPRPVAANQLDDFFKEFPSWVRTGFDSYPADEARRRLSLVYRLLFPFPEEFRVSSPAANAILGKSQRPATAGQVTPPKLPAKAADAPY